MKNFFSKFKIADYWHVKIFVMIPVIIVWTVLLVIIALK